MRVGLLSDSHDRVPAIAEFIKQFQALGIGLVLHAGDFCAPFAFKPIIHAGIAIPAVIARFVTDIALGYSVFQAIKPRKRVDLY